MKSRNRTQAEIEHAQDRVTPLERFQKRLGAHQHLFDYIEVYYNQMCLHSSLRYYTPREILRLLLS